MHGIVLGFGIVVVEKPSELCCHVKPMATDWMNFLLGCLDMGACVARGLNGSIQAHTNYRGAGS